MQSFRVNDFTRWQRVCAVLAVCIGTTAAQSREFACPANFKVHSGLNTGFPAGGKSRAFIVVPPDRAGEPAPVWVPLTGTVESTHDNLYSARSGQNALLAKAGFMVIGPVRECAAQNADQSAGVCNGPGIEGWNWRPWTEGRAVGPEGRRWADQAGPDADFLKAMVRCVGTKWRLDPRRYYVGGISSGRR